jgi:hypothetical protein
MAAPHGSSSGTVTQFLELLDSGTYYDFIDLNVAGLFDCVGNRTGDGIGRERPRLRRTFRNVRSPLLSF